MATLYIDFVRDYEEDLENPNDPYQNPEMEGSSLRNVNIDLGYKIAAPTMRCMLLIGHLTPQFCLSFLTDWRGH
jgi:hypothetical protein